MASTPDNGGFTGWTMLGIDPAKGKVPDAFAVPTRDSDAWLRAEVHVRTDTADLSGEAMLHLPKPVVVALTGPAAGAGAEIACAADYGLADTNAAIGSCLAGVGHVGNVVLMSRLTGPARATEIFLTGRMVSGEEAVRVGLFDRLCAPDRLGAELGALTDSFAALPTASVGLFKELRERSWGQPVEYGLCLQDAYHLRTHATVADAAEGLAAFTEKRPPRFTGA